MSKNLAIILAGGKGIRFEEETPKQFLKIAGKKIIEHTLDQFEKHHLIDDVFIVTNAPHFKETSFIVEKNNYQKVKKVLNGGNTRQESSKIGLYAAEKDYRKVLIHDAVRPFVSYKIIEEMIHRLDGYGSVDVAIPSPDTIIKINDQHIIEGIPERRCLRRGQTPQGFDFSLIKKAHEMAQKDCVTNATDDCSLILKYSLCDTYVVDGSDDNIKITYPIDIHIADKIFQIHHEHLFFNQNQNDLSHLNNKVMIVFGGSNGIGLEICRLSKQNGAKVYSFSRSNGCDIVHYSQVKKQIENVYEKEGQIDIVINTVGLLHRGYIERLDDESVLAMINSNFIGTVNVAKASTDYLKKTKGHLMFFGSSSYTRGRAQYSIYSATKAAVVNFAQGLSDELSDIPVKVNVINPERTKTNMRFNNFGKEESSELLDPIFVAFQTLNVTSTQLSGMVFDVRLFDQHGFDWEKLKKNLANFS